MENSQVKVIEALLHQFYSNLYSSEVYQKASSNDVAYDELVLTAGELVDLLHEFGLVKSAIEQVLKLQMV